MNRTTATGVRAAGIALEGRAHKVDAEEGFFDCVARRAAQVGTKQHRPATSLRMTVAEVAAVWPLFSQQSEER